jgi:hypothetical protein
MFMKKLGVAAALALCAVGASASNFRGGDQIYVPAVGHTQGSSGTFISDVYISNLSSDSVDVSVLLSEGPSGAQAEFRNVIRLRPFERKEYIDFLPTVLGRPTGFGQAIFNACLADADCGSGTQNNEGFSQNYRNISVESRIYSIPVGTTLSQRPPTTGQLFSGIPWYNFVSSLQQPQNLDKVFITGISQTGTGPGSYRSNIGLVNASQFSTTTLVVRIFRGDAPTTELASYEETLGPLGHAQRNVSVIFPNVTGSNLFVTVEQRNNVATGDAPSSCVQGCPAFLAYGSVLDNVSGDATTLEAQYLTPLSNDALLVIYPSGAGKSPIRRSARH